MTADIYKIAHYAGPLFRADTTNPNARNGANHYGSDTLHFFTTEKGEVASYTRKGTTYTKSWVTKPGVRLALLDIMDLNTRLFLETRISKENLDASFPIKNGKVYRNSETETAKIDGQIVFDICMLKDELGADGYYMARQEGGNGFLPFHSEIGLCNHAFGKLTLVGNVNVKKEAANAQNASFRKTRSVFASNGNRNRNGNGNRKTLKRSLFGSPSPNVKRGLFGSPGPLTRGNLNTTNNVSATRTLAF